MTELLLSLKMKEKAMKQANRLRKVDFFKNEFPLLTIESVDNSHSPIPALYTSLRVSREFYNTPHDLIVRSVRGDDDCCYDATIERRVTVNHNMDLIFRKESEELIDSLMEEKGYIDIYEEDDADFEIDILNKMLNHEDVGNLVKEKYTSNTHRLNYGHYDNMRYTDFIKSDIETLY